MLTKLHILIIFLPFISVALASILFLFFQILSNKNYLLNLIISFIFTFLLILVIIYKLNTNLGEQQIFYLIFSYLCIFFIFMSLVQIPISSLQLAILKIIYLNPGINRKEIIKKYNPSIIFEERVRRLESTNIIYKKKSSFFLKNKKILLYLNFMIVLKKLFNIKN